MNIFSTIIKDIESFASKFEKEFMKLFRSAPSWLTIAQGTLTYIAPLVVTALDLAGGPAMGASANSIIDEIKTKITLAVSATRSVAGATTLVSLLTDIQDLVPTFLAEVNVVNPTVTSKVKTYTDLILSELKALVESAPATAKAPNVITPALESPTAVA